MARYYFCFSFLFPDRFPLLFYRLLLCRHFLEKFILSFGGFLVQKLLLVLHERRPLEVRRTITFEINYCCLLRGFAKSKIFAEIESASDTGQND